MNCISHPSIHPSIHPSTNNSTMTSTATSSPQNQAAWYTAPSAHPFVVRDAPMPSPPAADQLTIRTHAVAFNPVDAKMQAAGFLITAYPAILGCDAAGTVTAVGTQAAEQGFEVGDRVAGCCDQAGERAGKGVFQQFCNLQVGMTGRLPDGVGWREGCTLPICLSTAAVGLCDERTLGLPVPKIGKQADEAEGKGKCVLIWGGASCVGSCAIQIAKAAGLRVAATAGERNLEYVKSIGADFAVDYRSEKAVEEIVGMLKGQGEFAGAFAAVMGREVYFACAEVCVKLGGKQVVSTVLPEFMKFEEDLPGGVGIAYSEFPFPVTLATYRLTMFADYGAWLVDNEVGPAIWRDWFTPALEKGILKAKPEPTVVGRGLEAIQVGVDAIAKGASATKYVVELP